MQPFARKLPGRNSPRRRGPFKGWLWLLGLLLPVIACSSSTEPKSDVLQGRWEGTSNTSVDYEYVFQSMKANSMNPRTGNDAPAYDLAYATTPGGSGTTTAWFESGTAYWGNSSTGTMTDDTTMTVAADGLAPFVMHKRP